MKKDLKKKKLEFEIEKIQIEIKDLKNGWFKPNVILNVLILITGFVSIVFLTRITDIKNERLLLEKETLKHDIVIFKQTRDSINNFIDSLRIVAFLFNDSVNNLNSYNKYLNNQLNTKEGKIQELLEEVTQFGNSKKAEILKNDITSIIENEKNNEPFFEGIEYFPNKPILFKLNSADFYIKIIDSDGSIYYEEEVIGMKFTRILAPNKKGKYLLNVYDKSGNITRSQKLFIR
jgi:hypothetical protein